MQRVYRYLEQEYKAPKKIFEINRDHRIIQDLALLIEVEPTSELINLTIEQLYDNALIIDGLHPNPASILPRVQQLMELALRASSPGTAEEE
jgi:molecular chaperone HtpG